MSVYYSSNDVDMIFHVTENEISHIYRETNITKLVKEVLESKYGADFQNYTLALKSELQKDLDTGQIFKSPDFYCIIKVDYANMEVYEMSKICHVGFDYNISTNTEDIESLIYSLKVFDIRFVDFLETLLRIIFNYDSRISDFDIESHIEDIKDLVNSRWGT